MKSNTNKYSFNLSTRELDVMNVLWSRNKATIASEIPKLNSELNINTVNDVIRKLLKKNYIKIEEFTHSHNVYARSYIPLISLEEYTLGCINNLTSDYSELTKTKLVIAILNQEKDDTLLNDLENIIENIKKEKE
jgi:predicted transcriptional regulator